MADNDGEKRGYEISSEERQLMVEAGIQFYFTSKAEFGGGWDPTLFYEDARFKNLPPPVQDELRAEIEAREKVEAAPAAEDSKAPEPEKKKKKEKKSKKKLTDPEIVVLRGENLDTALASAPTKEAKRMANILENAGRAEDAIKALTRAWETHDRKNKSDFNSLTRDLVLKIVQVFDIQTARKFVREKVRSVDPTLASSREIGLALATPAPPAEKVAEEPAVEPDALILDEQSVEQSLRTLGFDPGKSAEDNLGRLEEDLQRTKRETLEAISKADSTTQAEELIESALERLAEDMPEVQLQELGASFYLLAPEDFHPRDKMDYWKNYFTTLKDGLSKLTAKLREFEHELKEAIRTQPKKSAPKESKERSRGRRGKKEAIPEPAAARAEAATAAEAAGSRPRKTVAERKAEDEQVIAEKILRIKEKIDKAVAAKETIEGKVLEYPASFKFGRAIGMGEYTMLILYAEKPEQRPYILDRDAEACDRVVEEYLAEFAQAVGMPPEEARGRLQALVKVVYDERTAKGGEYIYPNIDPGFNGKRQRLKSGEDDIAALGLAEIGKRVQLPEGRRGQFAELLDFFEAARRMQNELVAADLQAGREKRKAEQLTATAQTLERAVASFIHGREEAAAQVEKLKYPGEFKFAGALRGGEDAIFALLDPDGAKPRDIVEIGIPAWRKTAEHFLPEFAREVGLSEQEFRAQLDKIIADLRARREKEGGQFRYQNIDPNGAQKKGRAIVSDWPVKKLLGKMNLPKDPENTVIEALDYFDALQDLRGRLKTSLRDQRAQARDAQGERAREMRENRELRLPAFAGEVELDALLWATDKAWWGEDDAGWESAREAVVLYQREHFREDKWSDERKTALREIMRMVWARREFVVAKKAVGTVGLDSRAARELLKLAGIKTRAIIPLVPPRRKPGAIHVNISGEEGVVSGASYHPKVKDARKSGKLYDPSDSKNNLAQYIRRGDRTLSFDHHHAGISLPDAAAAQYLFETLEFLGFFTDKNKHFNKEFAEKFGYTADTLRKALELVMFDDTKSHPAWKDRDSDYWKGPWQRSLLAIAARADFKSIVQYVKDHPDTDFTEEISKADAKKYGFIQKDGRSLVEKNEETFELAKKHWAELVERGYSVYTEEVRGKLRELSRYYLVETENSRLGKVKIVFVEAGQKNKGGYRGGGFPGSIDHLRGVGGRDVLYLIYNPPYERQGTDRKTYSMGEHIFATHTDKDLPEDLFPGGERLRNRMWNYTGTGLERQANIRAIFKRLGVPPEEFGKNVALEKAAKLEEYDPTRLLTLEEVGLDLEKAKVLREILREELVEKYADEFANEYPSMASRGREHVLSVAEDYVKDKGVEELEKKFQRTLHERMQREIAKERS